jgi:hypothetical protein
LGRALFENTFDPPHRDWIAPLDDAGEECSESGQDEHPADCGRKAGGAPLAAVRPEDQEAGSQEGAA